MSYSTRKSVQILLVVLIVSCVFLESAYGAKRYFRSRLSANDANKQFVLLYEHESFRGIVYITLIDWVLSKLAHYSKLSIEITIYNYWNKKIIGKEYIQYISKACINLPQEYSDWASSVDTHRTCASVCTSENCAGPCHNVYSNQGISKLRRIGFNDKIKSVKTCF